MQDISLLPEWNRDDVLQNLEKNPLDHKTMKAKLDRIYQITYNNELEYVPDVLDAYCWIKLAHEMDDFKRFFPTEKNEKEFYEDFVSTAIRYMIICKKFKNKVMMVLTQYMMLESLRLFAKKLGSLQKYLKMITILSFTFDHQKQFYKINYSVETVDRINSHKSITEVNFDDSNDENSDPEIKSRFVLRGEICSSQLFLDLLNFAHDDLDLFNIALEAVLNKRFNIEATSQLISFLMHIHPFFHRKWALEFIPKLTQGILDYVNKGDDITIRNFSKERYEAVISSVRQFLKRVTTLEQRKEIVEQFQLNLICRFLFSDFLDRKLQAISILTTFMKYSKNSLVKSREEFAQWIKEKQILKAIYHEKSHDELISRSSEFLQYYLLQKPSMQELSPLLELTDANIKLISEIFEYFPKEFQTEVVDKIKEKQNVTNKQALNIIKQTPGCEEWLLKNGGQCWVEVMREKTKRKADIALVFNQEFKVVKKITKEISDLYEGKFKTQFFLYMNEINYVSTVLQNEQISLKERLRYTALALEPLAQINDATYKAILPFTTKTIDALDADLQIFFVVLLDKLTKVHLRDLFQRNFTQSQDLSEIGMGQMSIFKKCFLLINEDQKNIEKKITFTYVSPHSYRKEKKQTLTIKVNPNQLNGMTQLMTIIFENKNISVSQQALQFIGFLFDRLDESLVDLVAEFKSKILDSCLQQFYKTEDQQQKYLKIIEKLMNQSEKDGIDQVSSVDSLFPVQMITIRVIDHFNVNKCKITMEVPSNFTLYELRTQIGRTINAYVHEMKISQNDQQIDPRLNGHIIHTLNLSNGDLVVQKKLTIEKISLCRPDGGLNQKARKVLSGMFKEYSTLGLMSKAQCQKYQQRCIGQITSLSQSRVDKIYEQYDQDKDGYLTEADFLKFYEVSAASKESAVWSNLETFGVRNDLQILTDQQVVYPDGQLLTRNLLFKNQTFVNKLVIMIQSPDQAQAKAAWKIISRLPLIRKPLNDFSIDQRYSFRYWLYLVQDSRQYDLVTKEILRKSLESDIETACIGLKIAHQCTEFDVQIFNITFKNMNKIFSLETLSFYYKVLLDNSLKLFDQCLKANADIRNQFIQNKDEYKKALIKGLMSNNTQIRAMYSKTIQQLILESFDSDFEIFEILFNLINKNFEECDKSTLTIEYFDLYSSLLQILQNHPQLYEKLKLNEETLAESMVELYKQHRCTETGLNSKPDHVSQGFLRILGKLLNKETQQIMVPFVSYLFKNSLFPENGQNKLKNSKTRKDAYELVYEICSLKNEKDESLGLRQLFNAGFKSVYKKMNQNKPTSMSFSYYYNYNQARSELGYAGIRNLGCICYMIAMLQQLFMTKAFRYLILMADDKEPENIVRKGTKQIDDNIFHQLKNMFANLQLTEKQDYNPEEFCFAFKDFEGQPINVTIQQDAQEFINLFFDKMEESLKRTPFRRIFSDVYGGKNCNLTVCSNCNAANQRYENFYPLSLEVKGYKSIQDSFKKYITGEVISDYQCDSCKKKTDVTKSCYLASTPNYFIIHLTRMCFNYDKFENEKVNSRWEFPHKLNLWEYSLDKLKGSINSKDQFDYELKGTVLHYGTADFGHYFSYIKENQNQWIEFNDERVRDYDPRDIESDCFGGQNWRRQSQSAYLLVYEKVKKRPIVLQFDTEEEKELSLHQFGLRKAVIEPEQKIEKKEQDLVEVQAKQKQSETQITKKPQQTQKPKILVSLDPMKISGYVPENLRQKISKANQEFSFSLNLSNDQFAYFLYKILSIQPTDELTTEYLELCYQCFHLKQIVEESTEEANSLTLSQWAAKRFKQIVKGHGWQFLKNFGKNWQSDILSIQKSTRIGIKNLLECVITDIIQSNNLNNEFEQVEEEQGQTEDARKLKTEKREIILQFLQKYTEMMGNEVTKHWHRFKQYFEVWLTLVEQNSFVRRYCEEKMMIEKILDFMLEDESPFTNTKKKYSMGNNYYTAQFQYPLQFMTLLITHGYELNDMENKCMKFYAFMSKVINFPAKHFNIIEYLCKGDEILSEKMAFLILHQTSKVNQSDGIKPIVNVIHSYLNINDQLKNKRRQWVLGIPQHIENSKTQSHGIWNVNIEQQYILTYYSPVRAQPILLQLVRFKSKAQHVAALLLSMLLQLQHDGHIINLQAYPAMQALEKDYTHWFEEFVDSYYEDTHRPYMAKNYVEYGNRLKALWNQRPNRQFERLPFYLIGKTIQKTIVSEQIFHEIIQLKVEDVTSELLEITPQNSFLNKKNIKNFAGSQNFRVKASYYSHSTFLALDKGVHSSDDEDNQKKQLVNPFDKRLQAVLFRKCMIKNLSDESLLITFKVTEEGEDNTVVPESAISFDIRSDSINVISLYKKDINKDFGKLIYHINILGKSIRENYWPRQIITRVVEEERITAAPDAKANSSGDESNDDFP